MGCTSSNAAGANKPSSMGKEKKKTDKKPPAKGDRGNALMIRDRRMSEETPLLRFEDFKVGPYIQTGAMGKVYKVINHE
jgi:hypothetical protein